MSVRRVDPARSRIVLVGVATYLDVSISDEPAIDKNITGLVSVLTDPALGAFDPEHLLIAPAGAGVAQVGDLLVRAAAEAEDLLLFYYAGHGFPTSRRAELHLSLAGTRTDRLAFTALPFDAVREAFLDSPARSRVVILDCCYSGKAIGRTLGDEAVLEQLDVAGTYTLTASPATRPATAALPGEPHTAFTGRLLHLLKTGSPQAGPDLSLGEIYRHLRARLRADGLPEPQQRGTATGDLLALTPNPGYTPSAPPIVQPAELPEDLRAGLESRYPKMRAAAVSELADWLEHSDPGRLLTARTVLQEVADTDRPEVASLARTALNRRRLSGKTPLEPKRPATTSPTGKPLLTDYRQHAITALETAERMARNHDKAPERAHTLAIVGATAVAIDPDKGSRLVREAEAIARATISSVEEMKMMAAVAAAMAAIDPDRAESLANSIPTSYGEEALCAVVAAVAPSDPDRAESIANSMTTGGLNRDKALATVVKIVVASDPDRAEAIAHSINDATCTPEALAAVAKAVAASDPGRSSRLIDEIERIASNLRQHPVKASQALSMAAEAVAASDPGRASRLASEAETIAHEITDKWLKSHSLAMVAKAVAVNNPDQAETMARDVPDKRVQGQALLGVMEVVAASDPDRAVRLASEVERDAVYFWMLIKVAKAWLLLE